MSEPQTREERLSKLMQQIEDINTPEETAKCLSEILNNTFESAAKARDEEWEDECTGWGSLRP